jgi:ubiquinone/menaquinone biosynthesis C-methylase UbiE
MMRWILVVGLLTGAVSGAAPPTPEDLLRTAAEELKRGDKESAYAYLQKALDGGYQDALGLAKAQEFAALRDEPRFKQMLWKVRAPQYIAMLERPQREEYQKKDRILAALALRPGERVADIGSGSGYFTIPVAQAVGPSGVVWAVDIRQELLDHVGGRAKAESLGNIRLKLVTPEDPQLEPGSIDTILMVDVYHYIQRGGEYAKRLAAAIAPGGRVVVIDFIPKPLSERPWGPPPEQDMPRSRLDAWMAGAGLKPARVHDFLTEQFFVEYKRN